ncbi:MAG: peptidylprolyl isomerase [Sulfurovum sp. FS06-10]|nr:MAG: peptidylprolyl isomerase [Sulfurovum sp. FS06-10]
MNKLFKTSILGLSIMTSALLASDILVTIDGTNITKQDVNAYIGQISPGTTYQSLQEGQQKQLLNYLVEKELFTKKAQEDGIEKTEAYKQEVENLKKEAMVSVWMKQMQNDIKISDDEAKKVYESQKKNYEEPESVKARHILVKTEQEAKDLIVQLKDLKDDALKDKFIALAKEKSTGPSGKDGGDLGWFSKGKMVPEFETASFAMKVGEVTAQPVKTQFGYHVLYVEGKKPASTTPFEEVKKSIVTQLQTKEFAKKIEALSTELKAKAKIEYTK